MATLKTGTTIAGQTAWHAGNDGPGSGLDADLIDGKQASVLRATVSTTAPTATRVGELWVDSDDLLLAEDDWQYPTMVNGWQNYHPTWEQARYARLIGGYCVMEGLIMNGGNGTTAFTLPVGYRPSHYFIQTSMHNANVAAILYIYPNGEVHPQYAVAGDTQWISIHGMFYIEG